MNTPALCSDVGFTGVAAGACRREQPGLNWYKVVGLRLRAATCQTATMGRHTHTHALNGDTARHQLLFDDTRDAHTHLKRECWTEEHGSGNVSLQIAIAKVALCSFCTNCMKSKVFVVFFLFWRVKPAKSQVCLLRCPLSPTSVPLRSCCCHTHIHTQTCTRM